MRNVSDKSCRVNQNTHYVLIFFFSKMSLFLDNVEKYGRAGKGTWQYGACALHAGYLMLHIHSLSAFRLQEWLQDRASMLRDAYIRCLSCTYSGRLHCHGARQ